MYKTVLKLLHCNSKKLLPIPRPAGSPPSNGGGGVVVVVVVAVLGALLGGCADVPDDAG